jgi:hypothetical protein
LEDLHESQSFDFILKSDIEQLILRYKTLFDDSNIEEKLECLRLNSSTLDNFNGSFEAMESFSNISSHKELTVKSPGASLNTSAKTKFKKYSDSMPFRSPIPVKNTYLHKSMDRSFSISKPFISKFEIDVASQSSSIDRKLNGSTLTNDLQNEVSDLKILQKLKTIEYRLRKEVKFLSSQNSDLKLLIENMKLFVPIAYYSKIEKVCYPKSWQTAAKIQESKTKKDEYNAQKKIFQDLVEEHMRLKREMVEMVSRTEGEKQALKDEFEATEAR